MSSAEIVRRHAQYRPDILYAYKIGQSQHSQLSPLDEYYSTNTGIIRTNKCARRIKSSIPMHCSSSTRHMQNAAGQHQQYYYKRVGAGDLVSV